VKDKPIMRQHAFVILALCAAWALSACNTVQGMGRDITKAGEVIEDAAKKK
jgi:predicted small secreted protein